MPRVPTTVRGARSARSVLDQTVAVHRELQRALEEALPVELWDGTRLGPDDAAYRIVLCRPWSLRRLLLPASDLAAGEAYVEGDIDLPGDAVAALTAAERLSARPLSPSTRLRLLRQLLALPAPPRRTHRRRARLTGRVHSRSRDRAAIAFHYDLPQKFYEQFLDRNLVYSCAYFADPAEPLETAQERKLELVCRKLRLRRGMRLLDIGCGWGSRHHGFEAVGVTLSRTQADAGRRRIAEAGLGDRVEIRLQDYRDVRGTFDAVCSIGMFEHVGLDRYREYFSALHRLTARGGLCLNHGITAGDPRDVRHRTGGTFVGTYVFPDGGLAPSWRAVQEMELAGFEVIDVEQLRPHYALTVRKWLGRLEQRAAAVVAAAGESSYRIWRAYLAGSAVSFEHRSLGVAQVLGSKDATTPLGRAWMIPQVASGDGPA